MKDDAVLEAAEEEEGEAAPPVGLGVRGVFLDLVGAVWLVRALYVAFGAALWFASPLTTDRPGYAGLFRQGLIIAGAIGVMLRKNWARRLLLVMTVLFTMGALNGLRKFDFQQFGARDWFVVFALLSAYLFSFIVLWRGKRETPSAAPRISRRRVALILLLILGAFSVSLFETAIDVGDRLEDLPRNGAGELDGLLRAREWEGETLRLTKVRDGKLHSEATGRWSLTITAEGEDRIRVCGLRFAEKLRVELDRSRNALIIHDAVFAGSPFEGRSPLFDEARFTGVRFEGYARRIYGEASILFLEDGRVVLNFDKVYVDGRRAREYGAVAPVASPPR